MFMPSGRVWNEMRYEPQGFWPSIINRGDEFALLVKTSTHVIKAAYRSCPVRLTIALTDTSVGTVLSSVVTIEDDPASPMGIVGVHRHAEEQTALDAIIRLGKTIIVFFDELSRPVLRAEVALSAEARGAADLLDSPKFLYAGEWLPSFNGVLDEIQEIIDPTRASPSPVTSRHVSVTATLSRFETQTITAVGAHEMREFRLEDRDEGYVLEHGTWHLVEQLFKGNVYHSPNVGKPPNQRELTDILGFCDVGMCFFETKAAAVLTTAPDRSTERRAKNIKKQIDKGLGQLVGAMNRVASGSRLTARDGREIALPAKMGPFRHCVVMVSELLPAVDWENVTAELLRLSHNDVTMFHVLDLHELRLLVGISKEDPILLVGYLDYRFEHIKKVGSALVRMKLDGPPLP